MDRKTRSILLVDNSASLLLYLGMLLKRLEYKAVTARSAEDALRMMEENLPSIVCTEISLPHMSGIDFLRQIKCSARYKATPVVMLTSEGDPAVRDTCERTGCAAYLVKPVEPDMLYRTLQSACESVPREHIRLATSLKVIVGDGTVMGGVLRTEYATAISEGGLYVRTLYPQPRNALTPIQIFINDEVITAKTEVLYTYDLGEGPFKEPGMGMKFVQISGTDRALIRKFIKEQLTRDIPAP
jgi:two-component system chemotaxis response regulator CheY